MKFSTVCLSCFIASAPLILAQSIQTRHGMYTGELRITPVHDGKNYRLLSPLGYDDGNGHQVTADRGFVTDGASIPRALWSVVGSPFSGGNYVEAAVIHDKACDTHEFTWQITHRLFYDAMVDEGVSPEQALLLYYGVRLGGPRWETVQISPGKNGVPPKVETKALKPEGVSEAKLKAFKRSIQSRANTGVPITVEEIDEDTASQISFSPNSQSPTTQTAGGSGNSQFQIGAGASVIASNCSAIGNGATATCTSDLNRVQSHFRCDGLRTAIGPGNNSMFELTSDPAFRSEYEYLMALGSSEDWKELSAESTRQLQRNQEWLTPYLFKADAEHRLSNDAEARSMLMEFEKRKGDAYQESPCLKIDRDLSNSLNSH